MLSPGASPRAARAARRAARAEAAWTRVVRTGQIQQLMAIGVHARRCKKVGRCRGGSGYCDVYRDMFTVHWPCSNPATCYRINCGAMWQILKHYNGCKLDDCRLCKSPEVVEAARAVNDECVVCMAAKRDMDIYLAPCHHRQLCTECADKFVGKPCPICRAYVTAVVNMF